MLTRLRRNLWFATCVALLNAAVPALALPMEPGTTRLVSVDSSGGPAGLLGATDPSISADGRYVAFMAATLGADEVTPGVWDVFVRDTHKDTTRVASVDSDGRQHAHRHGAWNPAISGNGRFVAFNTQARLVNGDRNGMSDVYLHDLRTRRTRLVSRTYNGQPANSSSTQPSVSHDGRYVAFSSDADNLLPTNNGRTSHVYVRDMRLGTTVRVSVPDGGGWANGYSYGPKISANGQRVAFLSDARNLTAQRPASKYGGTAFVRDLARRRTWMVSVSDDEKPSNRRVFEPLSMSRDGRVVAFSTLATNLVPGDDREIDRTYVRVIDAGTTEVVSLNTAGQHLFPSFTSSLSGDGRYVAFVTFANDPSVGDTTHGGDVYVRDRVLGTTVLASVTTTGVATGEIEPYEAPAMSADGLRVAFPSFASDVVEGDHNDEVDVFLRIREPLTSGTPAP